MAVVGIDNALKYLHLDNLELNYTKLAYSGLIGVGAYITLKQIYNYSKFRSYNYPVEIKFDSNNSTLGFRKEDFLEGLSTNHEKYLMTLKKLYNDECTLNLGRSALQLTEEKVVFLNSIEAVRKFSESVDKLEPIADRPRNYLLKLISRGYLGSFFRMFDNKLNEVRKSSLTGLHKLIGNGQEFEEKLIDEINQLAEFINSSLKRDEVDIEEANIYLQQLSTNIIVNIGFGTRFDYDLERSCTVKALIRDISELLSSMNLIQLTDFKSYDRFLQKETMNYVNKRIGSIYEFLGKIVGQYKKNYDPEVLITFADYLIGKQIEVLRKHKKINANDNYSDEDILVQVFTLLMAGAVSTGFTISWAFYYLSKDQHVQHKLFKHISDKCGVNSAISSKDKPNLPYVEACVNEALRLSSLQAIIPRAAVKDVQIGSYKIPAQTPVLINLYAIHRDDKYWKDEENFVPERWLNQDGTVKSYMDSFIPFGLKPRSCIGDNLSRQILFLLISNLIQRFKFDYLTTKDYDTTRLGVMRCPSPYCLKITVRK